jgi:hypothetical protein
MYMDSLAQRAKLAEETSARTARIEKLDTEISFRYSKAMRQLMVAAENRDSAGAGHLALRRSVAQLVARPRGNDVQGLFPEFEKMSVYGLLSDLRDQLVNAGYTSERQTQAGTVQNVLLKLSKLDDELNLDGITALEVAKRLKRAMFLPRIERAAQRVDVPVNGKDLPPPLSRWSKGFPQTDCKPDEIFC